MRILLRTLITLFIIFFISPQLFSQAGKISGRVVDKATGEGLPFVNVLVEGTQTGAASDLDGYYTILNVKPGEYNLRASAVGYNSVTVQNIRVSIDLTTRINFELGETTVTVDEVIITAERPLVTRDLTSSTAIIGADEIAALPVTEFQEVLQLKAGIVGGTVRGGRRGEVVFAIDGVPVTDVFDGGTVVDVSASSIQELQFISGSFNAEYGRALSGYVNISTKDGDNTFTGNITSYIGDYYSTKTNIFRAIDQFDPINIRNIEGSLSGPIVTNKLFFYTNVRYIYFGGWLSGRRVFNPWDITTNRGSTVPLETRYDIQRTGDGEIVPMNFNEKVYYQGKLTYRAFDNIKLTYNYIYDRVRFREYDHSFSFNPDGDLKRFRLGNTNILGLTHTLGATTFYQLNFSYFFKKYQHYVYEDANNPQWTNNLLLGQAPGDVPSFRTGGTLNNQFKRTTSTYGVKFDMTSQVTRHHQIKGGIEFNIHQLSFDNVTLIQELGLQDPQISGNPFARFRVPDFNNPDENLLIDIYERRPIEFSAYIQDKIELNEMIINVGIRMDYFSPDGQILNNINDPDIYRPRDPRNIYVGDTNNNGQLDPGDQRKTVEDRRAYWYKDATSKFQFSPRLGVAFPITDRGVIHFSYGHFFQIPNFDLLYTNPEYKFGQGTGNLGIAGNPDLNPQETVSGEVGLQQAISDDIAINLTGYFRDIRNLAGTRADEIRLFGGAGTYSQFVNSDFGFVKGIVLTISKRLSNNWAATLDYTLQSAKGNASDPAATRNLISGGQRPEIQLIRLDQDQTHTANFTFSYVSPDSWGGSIIAQYGSGFPFTPTQALNISDLLLNSEIRPSYFNVDLRGYYDVMISDYKISFFVRVFNLFDIANELNVYGDSGTANFTLDEYLRRQQNLPELVNSLDEFYRNPTFYSEPRRIELGATFFF